MNIVTYSHYCKLDDWKKERIASAVEILMNVRLKVEKGCSARLRSTILRELNKKGWSSKVKLSYISQISITATNGDIGLCLQTGNMSRFYADLLKLQYLYAKGNIKSAVYILPTKRTATLMGSNLAYFERFVGELKLFSEFITIPLYVIGID